MKIFAFALRPFDELAYLERACHELNVEFGWTSEYPTLENASLAAGADALTIITNPMTAELLDRYHKLGIRAIATRSIGYDHIDVNHARSLGMRVAHAAYPPEGVADYTIMLMLMALRRAKQVFRHAGVQNFGLEGKLGRSLGSCTVGVVGTGAIGSCVIRELAGFGCRVLACDPFPRDDVRAMAEYVELEELLSESDVVTLHAPGLAENRHMIGAAELALMKPDAVLINAARGMLVDTDALITALEQGAWEAPHLTPSNMRPVSTTSIEALTYSPTESAPSSWLCPTLLSRHTWRSTLPRTLSRWCAPTSRRCWRSPAERALRTRCGNRYAVRRFHAV